MPYGALAAVPCRRPRNQRLVFEELNERGTRTDFHCHRNGLYSVTDNFAAFAQQLGMEDLLPPPYMNG